MEIGLDGDSMDETNYLGVPTKIVEQIGRLVVVATRVENWLYSMAGALTLDERAMRSLPVSGRNVAQAVRRRVVEAGVPPWSTVEASEVAQFCSNAKGALFDRGKTVHALFSRQYNGGDDWRLQAQNASDPYVSRDVSIAELVKLRVALESLDTEGYRLLLGITPRLAPGLYVPANANGAVVYWVGDKDGYSPLPERREVIGEMWAEFKGRYPDVVFPETGEALG